MQIRTKRVYETPDSSDGFRVLADRLWPRGLSKARAAVDLWAKDVAPSAQLRTALHHDGLAWEDFVAAYTNELASNPAVAVLRTEIALHPVVTLLYGTHDSEHNHTPLLREALSSPPDASKAR